MPSFRMDSVQGAKVQEARRPSFKAPRLRERNAKDVRCKFQEGWCLCAGSKDVGIRVPSCRVQSFKGIGMTAPGCQGAGMTALG